MKLTDTISLLFIFSITSIMMLKMATAYNNLETKSNNIKSNYENNITS